MTTRKTIVVVGATGAQGGGLCHAILNDHAGAYACRALTRDPQKDKARALAARGAEVIAADLDDADSLTVAFRGSDGVYAVTNFWEHFSADKELAQARNIALAARAAGVPHVIWSTLEDTRAFMAPDDTRMPMLQGQFRVPHFDAKAEADAAFDATSTTYLLTSFYWDNLYAFGLAPKREEDGVYGWAFPMGDARLAGIAAEDIGAVAYAIFKAGSTYRGQRVGIASELLTIAQMGASLERVAGFGPVRYHDVSADAYRAFGFPGADELGNMFQVYRDFASAFAESRDPGLTRRLHPNLLTFEQFLIKHGDKIPR